MENLEKAINELKEKMPGLTLLENEPMNVHSSFRIGGPVRALAVPEDVMSLSRVCAVLKENRLAPMILGNGTNILFPDEGLKDLFIISTEKLTKMFLLLLYRVMPSGIYSCRLLPHSLFVVLLTSFL